MIDEWTEDQDSRFHDLAAKEALEEITPDELEELEELAGLRRELVCPRSPDEIEKDARQHEYIQELIGKFDRLITQLD
jgi:hypothetical protein